MDVAFFEHDHLRLRPVEERDLAQIAALRNDRDTWAWLGDPRPLFESDQKAWFSSIGSRSGRFYFVASYPGHPFVGMVRMDELDLINRSIRIGADVIPELRGKGFGARIFGTVLRYCFLELGVHRVWLAVLETNQRAIGLYRKTGFKDEGSWREAVFRGGKFVDYNLMSVLDHEWRARP